MKKTVGGTKCTKPAKSEKDWFSSQEINWEMVLQVEVKSRSPSIAKNERRTSNQLKGGERSRAIKVDRRRKVGRIKEGSTVEFGQTKVSRTTIYKKEREANIMGCS